MIVAVNTDESVRRPQGAGSPGHASQSATYDCAFERPGFAVDCR